VSTRRLSLLQINDVHGYVAPHPELFWSVGGPVTRTAGGYARVRTLFERVRDEMDGAVIALDNGDSLHGTHLAVSTRGEGLAEPLNALGLDAMTAHWEFAYGPAQLDRVLSQLRHPLLACNVVRSEDGAPAYTASVVIERAGLRVGVVGIAAVIVDKTMPAHFSEGLRFTLGRDEAREQIRLLRERERVDVMVVLSHLGFPQDCQLAQEVAGIDVLLSGHTHNRLAHPVRVGRTLIIQSGAHGSFIGRLDLEVGHDGLRAAEHRLVALDEDTEEDPGMARVVERLLAPAVSDLSEVVGHSEILLHRATALSAPMDDLLLAAIAQTAETELAFSNGWRFGAPIPRGPITRGELWNIVPPDPPVETVELTGGEVRAMMEENLERTFSRDPYAQQGGYVKRCRGLQAAIKIENPFGTRLQELLVGGDPIVEARRYRAAFLTTQGVPERYGRDRQRLDARAIQALESYLQDFPAVAQPATIIAA
jgi:sulfur-oxidizing protein SoxB